MTSLPPHEFLPAIASKCEKSKRSALSLTSEPFCAITGAEHLAQRRVHQVRRGVVETDTLTASLIYVGPPRHPLSVCAGDFPDMTNSLAVLLRVADCEREARAF